MADSRLSARRGRTVNLDAVFYRNGIAADPYAIRKIEIYRSSVAPHNLVTTVLFPHPNAATYPEPVVQTDTGRFYYPYDVPADAQVPDVYFDLWYYYADNPCNNEGTDVTAGTDGEACDLDSDDVELELLTSCHRFWMYPDGWATTDELSNVEFGFEALNIHFNAPETKMLQVGLMPLPLYDFDYNLIAPLIPYLTATISVETRHGELIIDAEDMTIGIRQGAYRTNPFVLRWLLDTSRFLIGTYRYKVTVTLPDGTTRTSPWAIFTVT